MSVEICTTLGPFLVYPVGNCYCLQKYNSHPAVKASLYHGTIFAPCFLVHLVADSKHFMSPGVTVLTHTLLCVVIASLYHGTISALFFWCTL